MRKLANIAVKKTAKGDFNMELLYFYLIATMPGGLLGYLWNDDVYQKEKNELLLTLVDKMKEAKEYRTQKEWLLEELDKLGIRNEELEVEATFEVSQPDGNQTSKVTA